MDPAGVRLNGVTAGTIRIWIQAEFHDRNLSAGPLLNVNFDGARCAKFRGMHRQKKDTHAAGCDPAI